MYDGMGNVFAAACVFFTLVGVAIAGACFWLVPWLWGLIKPWLHMVTT